MRAAPPDGRTATVPDVSTTEAAGPDPRGGEPDRGDGTPETDVEQRAGLLQRHLAQRPGTTLSPAGYTR